MSEQNLNKGIEKWETNAEYWDSFMGDDSNFFHRDLVRPTTEKLLDIQGGELVLDIGCGNGNYSEYLAAQGVDVVAIDYSPKMVELAKIRRAKFINKIEFRVCDVTQPEELTVIAKSRLFDKAVANMALMNIDNIEPLFKSLSELLKANGTFVFSMHHPCFETFFSSKNKRYLMNEEYQGIAIKNQPVNHYYYHRPLQEIFNIAFRHNFVLDGFSEIPLEGKTEPIIMIVSLRKKY